MILLLAACSRPLASVDDPDVGETFSADITAADGGHLETASGQFVLDVPANAVRSDLTVTVEVQPSTRDTLTAVYDLGPDGTLFDVPIVMGIGYEPAADLVGDVSGMFPVVATAMDSQWVSMLDSRVDGTRLVATTTHFSSYAVVGLPNESDAWFRLMHTSVQLAEQARETTGSPQLEVWFEDADGDRSRLSGPADPFIPTTHAQAAPPMGPGQVFVADREGTPMTPSEEIVIAPGGLYEFGAFDRPDGQPELTSSRIELPTPDLPGAGLVAFANLTDSPTVALYDMSGEDPRPLALASTEALALFQGSGELPLGIDQDLDGDVDRTATVYLGDGLTYVYFAYARVAEGFPIPEEGYVLVVQQAPNGGLSMMLLAGPTATRYSAIAAADGVTCGLANDFPVCWGSDADGIVSQTPAIAAARIFVGPTTACAINDLGEFTCWGAMGTMGLAGNLLTDVAIGRDFLCGLLEGGAVACQSPWASPPEQYRQLDAADLFACGVDTGSVVRCWGEVPAGIVDAMPTAGEFEEVRVANDHVCARRSLELGPPSLVCWGADVTGSVDGPFPEPVEAFDVTDGATCFIELGAPAAQCVGEMPAPGPGEGLFPFDAIVLGGGHGCVLGGAAGEVSCWGDNGDGESDPP